MRELLAFIRRVGEKPSRTITAYFGLKECIKYGKALNKIGAAKLRDVFEAKHQASQQKDASHFWTEWPIDASSVTKLAIKEITPEVLKDITDADLLSTHRRLHQLFAGNFEGNDKTTAGDLNREDLVNAEIFVQNEMADRDMEHEADNITKNKALLLGELGREK